MSKYQQLTKEELLEIVEKQAEQLSKKYGLMWDAERVAEDVVVDCENNLPVLTELADKQIQTTNNEANLLIEGDNYHALTVLNYTHKEKIDVIYIDPPYNTGNKDFVYNDHYVDKEDGYRHSKWLNFMQKRLTLAKNLLTEKGVIFISIDDNEQARLKLLCDEVFGEANFVGNLIVQSNPRGSQASKHFATTHEYVFCYAKNSEFLELKGEEKSEDIISEYKFVDIIEGKKVNYRLLGLRQRGGAWKREDRPKMYYPIFVNPETGECNLSQNNNFSIEVLPKRPTGEEGRWTWSKEKFEKDKNLIIGKKISRKGADNIWDIFRKDYLSINGENKTSKIKTILVEKELNYQNGRTAVKEVLANDAFDYPKPVYLIKKIVKIASDKNSTILDFMAGSGTTGQAVLELNKEDGGNRTFILCTNNELNGVGSDLAKKQRPEGLSDEEFENWKEQFGICQRVTYPRLEKVIKGYNKNGDGDWIEGLGGSLRYFKTDFVKNSVNRDQVRFNLTAKCTDMLCNELK